MNLNKALYKITDVVWYISKNLTTGEVTLKKSAVTEWTARNNNSGVLEYSYTLADGTCLSEGNLFVSPLVLISRLLKTQKRNYILADFSIENFMITNMELLCNYINDSERFYHIRESYQGQSLSGFEISNSTDGGQKIDFRKHFESCNFSQMILEINLWRCNFYDCDFYSTTLTSGILNGCILRDCNFTLGIMEGVQFKASDLKNCIFANANMTDAVLKRAKIINSDFSYLNGNSMNLKDANVSGSKFFESDITFTIFQYANCSKVDFRDANLTHCNFEKAILTEANLTDAKLIDATFEGAIGITDEQLYNFANKDVGEYTFTGIKGTLISVP